MLSALGVLSAVVLWSVWAGVLCPAVPPPQDQPSASRTVEPPAGSGYVTPAPSQSVEIGNFYLRRKKYHGALSRFQEAAHTDPEYAPAYLGLGKVYEKLGMDARALSAYQKYLDLLPSDKDADDAKDVHRAIERLRKDKAPSD
ncbi:MAG TPA: tetratricopeptide repeat protein [Terriglobia bacterium]|nr:tetratricopeptide repeat protein [Terriglobia bacterium]